MPRIFIAFIVLTVSTGVMLGACDSWVRSQHKKTELEQCAHDCHTLYGTIEGKLVDCMEKCDRRFLHTGVAE